jgi:hypothetical protein
MRIRHFNEEAFDYPCNLAWFVGDAVFMLSATCRLCSDVAEYLRLAASHSADGATLIAAEHVGSSGVAMAKTSTELVDRSMSFIIALTELGVSVHYANLWRFREGHVGLMGVISSSFIILQELRKNYLLL